MSETMAKGYKKKRHEPGTPLPLRLVATRVVVLAAWWLLSNVWSINAVAITIDR